MVFYYLEESRCGLIVPIEDAKSLNVAQVFVESTPMQEYLCI